jgi:hypothetical protein
VFGALRGGEGIPPKNKASIGNSKIIEQPLLAFACSAKCPPSLVLRGYDLASALRNNGIAVASGFHTTIERDCLHFLLRGTQPIEICPARGIERMRVPPEWKDPAGGGAAARHLAQSRARASRDGRAG